MTTDSDDFGAGENYITEGDVAADQEDLSDYKFSKFAATYFTASVMHSYLRFYSLYLLTIFAFWTFFFDKIERNEKFSFNSFGH